MTDTITSLIEKLEGDRVGSRELDAHVWASVNGYELFEHDGAGWRYRMRPDDIMRHERTSYISPVTTSLDAALALAERVLPGWYWRAGRTPLGQWHHGRYTYGWAHLSRTDASNCDRGDESTGWAATPALALCAALLRAQSEAR